MKNYTVEENNHCTIITIPAKKDFTLIAFCITMLCSIVAILIGNLPTAQSMEKFILIFIAIVFGFIAIVGLSILFNGKEIITCYKDYLTIEYHLHSIKLKRKYYYNKINDLRIFTESKNPTIVSHTRRRNTLRISIDFNINHYEPLILFQYQNKSIQCVYSINEKEANVLIDLIKTNIQNFKDDREKHYGPAYH